MTNNITLVSVGTMGTASASTTVAAPYPNDLANLDVAILHLHQTTSNSAITTPAGWTLIARQQRTTTHVAAAFYKVLNGTETGTVTVTVASSSVLQAVIQVHRGVDTSNVLDIAAGTTTISGGSGITTVDVAVVTANTRVVALVASNGAVPVYLLRSYNLATYGPLSRYSDFTSQMVYEGAPFTQAGVSMSITAAFRETTNLLAGAHATNAMAFTAAATGNYISITVPLRSLNTTTPPPCQTLAALTLQAPLATDGALMSTKDISACRMVVQVADPYTDDGGIWDVSFWDTPSFAGYQWHDVSSRVRAVTWSRGAEQPGGRPRVGTATVTLSNTDGVASPWATTGAFVQGRSWLRPGLLVRFGETDTGAWHPWFTGTVETLPESTSDGADGWVDVNLVETTAYLALVNNPAQTPVGAGDSLIGSSPATMGRVSRLLVDAAWPYAITSITGNIDSLHGETYQATTMAGERLSELFLTGDSMATAILAGPDGSLTVRDLTSRFASGYTFSNYPESDGGGSLPIARDAVTPYASTDRILNVATAARAGGSQQSVSHTGSVAQYGPIASGYGLPRSDLIVNEDAPVLRWLTALLYGDTTIGVAAHAFDEIGIEAIELDADMKPTTLYKTMSDIMNRGVDYPLSFTVIWHHPSGSVYTVGLSIDGFTNSITMEGQSAKWTATVNTSALTPATS